MSPTSGRAIDRARAIGFRRHFVGVPQVFHIWLSEAGVAQRVKL
jgi:hypothetical protein